MPSTTSTMIWTQIQIKSSYKKINNKKATMFCLKEILVITTMQSFKDLIYYYVYIWSLTVLIMSQQLSGQSTNMLIWRPNVGFDSWLGQSVFHNIFHIIIIIKSSLHLKYYIFIYSTYSIYIYIHMLHWYIQYIYNILVPLSGR